MKKILVGGRSSSGAWRVDLGACDPGTGDWPMWGGTPDRNMVSNMKGLPIEWDVKTKKNVKWVAQLGSQSYGNPVVAGGMVFVGTNNEALRDPKAAWRSRRADGVPRSRTANSSGSRRTRSSRRAAPTTGRTRASRSSPLVEGDTLYYVSNRGVLWCLDINGFRTARTTVRSPTKSSPARTTRT